MSELTVGVVRQDDAGERRVALVPESVARLAALGLGTVVQEGAGAAAWFPDAEYAAAGATVVPGAAVYEQADVVVCVRPPDAAPLRTGQLLLGLLQPLLDPGLARTLAEAGVTAVSLDGLPRTLSRAQSMDVLTSQANVAGYKAAAARRRRYGGYFPMLMTAAGTIRPASVLVLGAGVAGLQAIGTARRLGARRHRLRRARRPPGPTSPPPARPCWTWPRSGLGGTGDGGYARELTADEATPPAGRDDRRDRPVRRASSPPRRCRGGARRCWSPPRRWPRCGPARWWSTWPPSELGGNVVGLDARAHRGDRQRRHRGRRRQPARRGPAGRVRPRTRATSSRCWPTWSRTARSCSTRPTRSPPASSSPTTGRSCTRPYAAAAERRPRR